MYLTDTTYWLLLVHIVLTLVVLLFAWFWKRLGTRLYVWSVRVLLVVSFACLVASTSVAPRDIVSDIQLRYSTLTGDNLCLRDIDYMTRLLFLCWSLLLFATILTRRDRTQKLTLALSCQYVALRYNCNFARLMKLCEKYGYRFFPIDDLERFLVQNYNSVDDYIDLFEEQEGDRVDGENRYANDMKEARARYELTQHKDITQRRIDAAMSYEQYRAFKHGNGQFLATPNSVCDSRTTISSQPVNTERDGTVVGGNDQRHG